jgi:hypothetical protein
MNMDRVLWLQRSSKNCDTKFICRGGIVWADMSVIKNFVEIDPVLDKDSKFTLYLMEELHYIEDLVELLYLGKKVVCGWKIPHIIQIVLHVRMDLGNLSFKLHSGTQSINEELPKYVISINNCKYLSCALYDSVFIFFRVLFCRV